MISWDERKRRLSRVDQFMKQEGLTAFLIVGSGSCGPRQYGYYRYFVDNRVYYYLQALVMVPDQEPTVLCASQTHQDTLRSRGFNDIRLCGDNILGGLEKTLEDRGLISGRIGFCADHFPAFWYDEICRCFPEIQLADLESSLALMRGDRSPEEIEAAKRSAHLGSMGADRAAKHAVPGTSINDLFAQIDYAMKMNGAEETLVRLSVTASGQDGPPAVHFPANDRRCLVNGDYVCAEISPRFEGYWTQLIRMFCVGPWDNRGEVLCNTVRQALCFGAEKLVPGNDPASAAEAVRLFLTRSGCRAEVEVSVCGQDLYEQSTGDKTNHVFKDGLSVILSATAVPNEGGSGVRWGDTYLVTDRGGVLLTAASDTEKAKKEGGTD